MRRRRSLPLHGSSSSSSSSNSDGRSSNSGYDDDDGRDAFHSHSDSTTAPVGVVDDGFDIDVSTFSETDGIRSRQITWDDDRGTWGFLGEGAMAAAVAAG